MQRAEIAVVGVDVAKRIFQIHAADARGHALMRKTLRRDQVLPFFAQLEPTLVGMEACGGSHHWAREIRALGHTVRLMAPQFVRPYVKGNKDDRADAEAIAEAVTRPGMRFVAVKEVWQQDLLMVHRVRERLIKARTALTNEIRGLLNEYGIVFPRGRHHLRSGLFKLLGAPEGRLSKQVIHLVQMLVEEWTAVDQRVEAYEEIIKRAHRSHEACRKLGKIPGIGPITATAMVATIGDPRFFRNGRQFSAFLGIVPRHDGTGGNIRLKGISKRGDRYLRKLLIHGARAVLRAATRKPDHPQRWVRQISERRGFNKACVALANKNARQCWAVLAGRSPLVDATGYPPHPVDKGICSASPCPQDAVDIPDPALH